MDSPLEVVAKTILNREEDAMLAKKVICAVSFSKNKVVSGYFARPKKSCKFCPIVSHKYTKSFIMYQKFRACTPMRFKRWIRPGFWITSIDLTVVYHV